MPKHTWYLRQMVAQRNEEEKPQKVEKHEFKHKKW